MLVSLSRLAISFFALDYREGTILSYRLQNTASVSNDLV